MPDIRNKLKELWSKKTKDFTLFYIPPPPHAQRSQDQRRRFSVNMYRQVLMMLVFAWLLMIGSGCVSYHVTTDPRWEGEMGYKVIDTTIKRRYDTWTGPATSQIGADENGFTIIRETGSTITDSGDCWITTTYGRAETHRWTDIEDITVRAVFGGILFCGIFDLTADSCVRLKLKDGTTLEISVHQFPMLIAPMWLVSSEWRRAHKVGKAFQSIVEYANQQPKENRVW